MHHRWVGEAGPRKRLGRMQRRQIIERGAAGDGDLIRLGIDLGQLVARVVALELRFLARLRCERDGPADLQDHLGHGLAQPPDLVGVFPEVLGDVAGLGIAHMDVQDRRARVEAVHRYLGLFFPGHGKPLFGRAIPRHPHRPIGRRRDHQRGLIFGQQRIVGEVHGRFPWLRFQAECVLGQVSWRWRHRSAEGSARPIKCTVRAIPGGVSV